MAKSADAGRFNWRGDRKFAGHRAHITQRGEGDRKRPKPATLWPGAGRLNVDFYSGVSNTNLMWEMDVRNLRELNLSDVGLDN
jgi:hypothetical protein